LSSQSKENFKMMKNLRAVRAMALSAALLASTSIGAVAQVGVIGNSSGSPIGGAGTPMGATQPFSAATNGGTSGTSASSRGAFTPPINPYITNYGVGGMQPPPGSPPGIGMPRR
jgi:hypothetical protein